MMTVKKEEKIKDSVAVIATTPDSMLLLQLRDDIEGIEYPGYWSLIAGWVEHLEHPIMTLEREINEELITTDEKNLSLGAFQFLGSCDRDDRPWTEYVFQRQVLNPPEKLLITEGQRLGVFTYEQCLELERLAPHHKMHLTKYRNEVFNNLNNKEKVAMAISINDYIEVTQLGLQKDYEALEVGDGYVLSSTDLPTGVIHTKEDAKIIALLIFAHNVPRGDHSHNKKIEYMIVLRGKLKCSFALPDAPDEVLDIILDAGQQARILPGCIHTFTALDGDVYALEYSPQKYKGSDVL